MEGINYFDAIGAAVEQLKTCQFKPTYLICGSVHIQFIKNRNVIRRLRIK